MRGGLWRLICVVIGLAASLGAGLPAVAQSAPPPTSGQAIIDGLRRDADEANRRAAEARRRADELDRGRRCHDEIREIVVRRGIEPRIVRGIRQSIPITDDELRAGLRGCELKSELARRLPEFR